MEGPKRLVVVAAVIFANLGGVRGKALRWQVDDGSSSWKPAVETAGGEGHGMQKSMLGLPPLPLPTPAPRIGAEMLELRKRQLVDEDSDVCGFIEGGLGEAVGCSIGSYCAANPRLSAVGCCEGGLSDCVVPTTCMGMKELNTAVVINRDLVASCDDPNGLLTECLTFTYSGGRLDGFQGFACWMEEQTVTVAETPNTIGGPTREAPPPGPDETFSFETQRPLNPSLFISVGDATASGSAAKVTAGAKEATDVNNGDGSELNIPAIVGGVVGGLAVVSIVLVAAVYLVRKKREQDYRFSKTVVPEPQSPVSRRNSE